MTVTTSVSRVIDATGIDSMATAIGTLPEPTESVHMWIGGKHSLGHLLPAVLQLAAPSTITAAAIATLTFSKANAEEWADLIDHGQLANLTVVTSVYFEKTSANIFDYATGLLRPRGADVFTLRCHCKLACLQLSDGRTITAESSSNTRSAKTLEQLTIFGSPAVYAFHTDQIKRGREMQGFEFTGANRKG